MRRTILDGRNMRTREDAHRELREKLALPSYYGNNLDALFDCITTMKAQVFMENADAMLESLGIYGERLLETFRDGAAENPGFIFTRL